MLTGLQCSESEVIEWQKIMVLWRSGGLFLDHLSESGDSDLALALSGACDPAWVGKKMSHNNMAKWARAPVNRAAKQAPAVLWLMQKYCW